MIKNILITLLSIWAIVSIFLIIQLNNNPVVVSIGETKIHQQSLNKVLNERYSDIILDNMIETEMLKNKAKEEKIDISMIANQEILNDSQKDNIITAILEKTTTVPELKVNKDILSKEVSIYDLGHEEGMDLINNYHKQHDIQKVVKELEIPSDKIKKLVIDKKMDLFKQVESMETGDINMIMEGSTHFVILVEKINFTDKKIDEENSDEEIKKYIQENYKIKKADLLKELEEKYLANY